MKVSSSLLLATPCVALLAAGCLDPKDRRPGLWLSGDPVTGPAADWSFTDEHAEIFVEVRTPYLLRHSITVVCVAVDGRLYLGARRPTEKRWVAWVARDPRVRLGIGGRVHEARLGRIDDPEEEEEVYRAYARKYGWELLPPPARPEVRYFRVLPPVDPMRGSAGSAAGRLPLRAARLAGRGEVR